jgi:SAM-dependent methyltransferase
MDKNRDTYNSGAVVKWYEDLSEITAAERTIFERYSAFLETADVLDIGIGGGRTTKYLSGKCRSYTGIDYSEKFVDSCRKRFPQLKIDLCDARDLSRFPSGSFDFVNFSFNGIDYVDLEGREKIFSGISRILKPGGIFFFSTHNREHSSFNKKPWTNKTNSFVINLKTFLKLLPFLPRKAKNKRHETITADFAIINDFAHNYSLMTFYTTPGFLRKQLKENNFTDIKFFTNKGIESPDKELDDWMFITCLRTSA